MVEGVLIGGLGALAAGTTIINAASTGNNITAHNPVSIIQPTRLANKIIRYE
jgi:hypothetical protein